MPFFGGGLRWPLQKSIDQLQIDEKRGVVYLLIVRSSDEPIKRAEMGLPLALLINNIQNTKVETGTYETARPDLAAREAVVERP